MNIIVFDIEANGLEDVSKIHCIVAKDINNSSPDLYLRRFYNYHTNLADYDFPLFKVKDFFDNQKVLIGHNIIGYDNDLLERFFNIDLSDKIIVDTLIMSQTLNPDRKLPAKCPPSVYNPVTGQNDKIGPHSLAAWGYRVGRYKPEHYDWENFSPKMLVRCTEDVEIQTLVFFELLKEAGMTFKEFKEDYLNV